MMVIPCFPRFFASLAGVSGTVGATTLTVAQLASHQHPNRARNNYYGTGARIGNGTDEGQVVGTEDILAAGGSQSHTHSLTGVKSGSASSLPPYYALAYIMRCA